MAMNFKKVKPDDFENLCRDVLIDYGNEIIANTGKGPDGGKDLIIKVNPTDKAHIFNEDIQYIVQCKNNSISGKSVGDADIGDWRSICNKNACGGYLLILTTHPTKNLRENLEAAGKQEYKTKIIDGKEFEEMIEGCSNSTAIISRYNLKSELNNLFDTVIKIVNNEEQLPYQLEKMIIDQKILIFSTEIEKFEENRTEKSRIGILCDETPKENYKELLEIHSLSKLTVISWVKSKLDDTDVIHYKSFDEFMDEMSKIRDHNYQSIIVDTILTSRFNPTGIKLLYQLKNISYRPLPELINLFTKFFDDSRTLKIGTDFCLALMAVSDLAAKWGLKNLSGKTFELIKFLESNDTLPETPRSMLVSSLSRNLSKIDPEKKYLEKVMLLFKNTSLIQYKIDLLNYINLSSKEDAKKLACHLNKHYKKNVIVSPNNLIRIGSDCGIVLDQVPWTVEKFLRTEGLIS